MTIDRKLETSAASWIFKYGEFAKSSISWMILQLPQQAANPFKAALSELEPLYSDLLGSAASAPSSGPAQSRESAETSDRVAPSGGDSGQPIARIRPEKLRQFPGPEGPSRTPPIGLSWHTSGTFCEQCRRDFFGYACPRCSPPQPHRFRVTSTGHEPVYVWASESDELIQKVSDHLVAEEISIRPDGTVYLGEREVGKIEPSGDGAARALFTWCTP